MKAIVIGTSNSSKIKEGSCLFIYILNLEFHFNPNLGGWVKLTPA